MSKELPRRGGAHTFEQLEAEVLGQQAANTSTLSGADMTAPKEVVPKGEEAKPAGDKSAPGK
jgi:hypothetical protein